MRYGRQGAVLYWRWKGPQREDFGARGLIVRFVVNIIALWAAQFLIPGFWINGLGSLVFGAVVFGTVNAFIKPMLLMFSCLLTCATLGFFTLIVNALMLALTAWIAGLFDLSFHLDGFLAAFFGALVISLVSTLLSKWADSHMLRPANRNRTEW